MLFSGLKSTSHELAGKPLRWLNAGSCDKQAASSAAGRLAGTFAEGVVFEPNVHQENSSTLLHPTFQLTLVRNGRLIAGQARDQ